MLYLTIKNNKIENFVEKPFSSIKGFTLGAPTCPWRCDDPSELDYSYHHARSNVVNAFVKEALDSSDRKVADQSCGFWLGDMRDTSCRFYSWGAIQSSDYLIPDPLYLQARGYEDFISSNRPWHLKKNVVFWRGSLTRPIDFWERDPWEYPRYKLVESLITHPSCDVRLCSADYGFVGGPCFANTASNKYHQMGTQRIHSIVRRVQKSMLYRLNLMELSDAFIDRKIRIYREKLLQRFEKDLNNRGFTSRSLPMAEWGNYRYAIDIDGFGPSWKLFPCLALGMVIFKVESDRNLFFSKSLRPYEHYIPVSRDLSDLQARISWALGHQKECALISENAVNFCKYAFSYTSALVNFVSSLDE